MPSTPLEHVVIVVKENHGFDTYFGRFPGVEGDATLAPAANPPAVDPSHTHEAWLRRATDAVAEQYGESDIPAYWDYARRYTLCDHYFTDVAGPSTPNHLMLITGDSPIIDNPHSGYRTGPNAPAFDLPSLPAQLEQAGLTWGNYGGYAFEFVHALAGRNARTSSQFAQDASAGNLPTVSWVYAEHALSEHPPDSAADRAAGVGDVTKGMEWTVAQVDAIVAGGLWDKTAIFVTWDDWGGWTDHVDPPEVEKWTDGTQFRYGGRVPCLVVGAYAKQGHVSKTVCSHVSLLRFCETTFGLPSVNGRTAAADPMSDCFDFSRKLPPPQTGSPQQPTASPLQPGDHVLRTIGNAAASAAARIEDARNAVTDAGVRRQLEYAAEDIATIERLTRKR
jgi:phospholipase C